ncbi:hypothetical protein [Nocardioides limicola]|uniref:hypothetical protein n=1 Tax=Nocardioides limicola TaxID=2803368 RepID=UPI00193C23F2|nr:hypothetical protein [Nocardioides sp. DJM-14]
MFTITATHPSMFDPTEWGPANHNPENPHSVEATQAAIDQRDNDGLRPDDN